MSVSEDRRAWTRPGVFEVAPGVYRIPLPLPNDGLRAVNVYALVDHDGLTLIDSGWALDEAEQVLATALRELGYGLGDVGRFLITHAHRDHYTQAVALRERFGTTIALGRGEQPTLDVLALDPAGRMRQRLADLMRCGAAELVDRLVRSWSHDDFDLTHWTYPDSWFEGEESIKVGDRVLDVIATPGHTRGHVVFRDARAGVLFAGDHVLPQITPSIGFEPAPAESALADYLDSLRRLRDQPDTQLLPAHGPVTGSTHDRIDELLQHHRIRLDDAWRAADTGAQTATEYARVLRWTRRETHFDSLPLFDQMLAVVETAAHLKVLVATGRMSVVSGPEDRYRALG